MTAAPSRRVLAVEVSSYEDVPDATLRGHHTTYTITTTTTHPQRTCTVQRRFSEWRNLHTQNKISTIPFPEPRRLVHRRSLKEQRRAAMQAYLEALVASTDEVAPLKLCAFLGVPGDAGPSTTEELPHCAPAEEEQKEGAEPCSDRAAAMPELLDDPLPKDRSARHERLRLMARAWLGVLKCGLGVHHTFFGSRMPLLVWLAFWALWLVSHVDVIAGAALGWAVHHHGLRLTPVATLAVSVYALDVARAACGASAEATGTSSAALRLWWGVALDAARLGEPTLPPLAAAAAAHVVEMAIEAALLRQRNHVRHRRIRNWLLAVSGVPRAAAAVMLPLQLWFAAEVSDGGGSGGGGDGSSSDEGWNNTRGEGAGVPPALCALVTAAVLKEAILRTELASWARLGERLRAGEKSRRRHDAATAEEERAAADERARKPVVTPDVSSTAGPPASAVAAEAAARRPRPSYMAAPLASAAEGALECLPHELRQLALPIVRHLFSTGHASLPPGAGVESLRAVVQTVGAAASLVLSRALLDESGRMQLWLGLKALAESSPGLAASAENGTGLDLLRAFTRQQHAFTVGLQGSMVLSKELAAEEGVPLGRLFHPREPTPLRVAPAPGDLVRVRYPYKPSKAHHEEGLFAATVTHVHPGNAEVDVRYSDDIELVAGDECAEATLNFLDKLDEVNAVWRLWVRGLSVVLTVPPDRTHAEPPAPLPPPAESVEARPPKDRPLASPPSHRWSSGLDGSVVEDGEEDEGKEREGEQEEDGEDEALPPLLRSATGLDGSAVKTIGVDWAEPSAEERAAGVFGALVFSVSLPRVLIDATLRQGRFWSDSLLLKLGRFSDVSVVFEEGQVGAKVRLSFEQDGLYLTIESLDLAVGQIRVGEVSQRSEKSRRWRALLGTVSGLQWLLKGFLERKLLDIISAATVSSNQHALLFRWVDLGWARDIDHRVRLWRFHAQQRRRVLERAAIAVQCAWRQWRREQRARLCDATEVSLWHT